MTKTALLTADEISMKSRVVPMDAMQKATLDAALRTGKRVGVSVEQGKFNVVICSFAIGKKGRPTGSAAIEVLAANLDRAAVIPVLEAL